MRRIISHASVKGRKEHCLWLFSLLACAKRPLKWREIQGARSVDLQNQRVDWRKRKFVIDAKELCGSLVERYSDGTIQLVHITVRR